MTGNRPRLTVPHPPDAVRSDGRTTNEACAALPPLRAALRRTTHSLKHPRPCLPIPLPTAPPGGALREAYGVREGSLGSARHFGPRGLWGPRGFSVRGHPCPHVPNSLPHHPQSRHNDSQNDSPHNHGSAFTMKALHMAREGKPARAPALPGWPTLGKDPGRVNAFSGFPRRGGRGTGGGGETTRELRAGMPADQVGAPPSSKIWAV